jgi:hypothetical protein
MKYCCALQNASQVSTAVSNPALRSLIVLTKAIGPAGAPYANAKSACLSPCPTNGWILNCCTPSLLKERVHCRSSIANAFRQMACHRAHPCRRAGLLPLRVSSRREYRHPAIDEPVRCATRTARRRCR